LALFEEQAGNPPLAGLSRAAGVAFRTWLQHPDRGTTTKTARDRLTWVKSLLKHAQIELEFIPRSPWEGLDIEAVTTHRRRPWTDDELETFFSAPLHAQYLLPTDTKAGADAAYWVPVLGLYSGARISELIQLRRRDIEVLGDIHVMSVTDQGEDQKVKTAASVRKVSLHGELVRLGFMEYVERIAPKPDDPLWPLVPLREGKSGGFVWRRQWKSG
jgi:integrase